jgi:hypothetical protein
MKKMASGIGGLFKNTLKMKGTVTTTDLSRTEGTLLEKVNIVNTKESPLESRTFDSRGSKKRGKAAKSKLQKGDRSDSLVMNQDLDNDT